ncbi:SWIM zinc finger family protein [Tritrichomonas foetus]|uniref:SWIM zinc finger family protein n=1 Tax=Tritrichomonas foetus TaxID=1144522 RepID=A0A1J4JEI3_9EUKA|nr:SWIM zinc finger family protein [Tritrichomonas foetus]|eukprot:OHS96703.1 SWIM zinc finger family protein [Tritrichomonas foetus]
MDAGECGFIDLMKKVEEEGFTHEVQMFLSVLLPKSLVTSAMNLLYQEATIKCFIAKTSRRVYWTVLSKSHNYVVFSDQNTKFCSCLAFSNYVIKKGQFPFCKHVLTVLICEALRKKGETSQFSVEEIDDDIFKTNLAVVTFNSNFKATNKK